MKRYLIALSVLFSGVDAAVLASVNGSDITSEEVNKVLMEGTQGRFDTLPLDKQQELRQRIIEGMIAQELVFEDAKKSGVLDSASYKQELELVVRKIEVQLAARYWEQELLDSIKVEPKEIKAYFDANIDEFVDKEKVHARHILLKTESDAQAVIKSLRTFSGEKLKNEFIAQAKSKSTGPSASKGGDLGYVVRGQMVPSFNDAIFSTRVGTVNSSAVQSQFGYHVIYIEDKKGAKKLSFNEVKDFIEQKLKMDKFKAQLDKKMNELRSKAKVTIAK